MAGAVASIWDNPAREDCQLVMPRDIGVDAEGNMYLADEHHLKTGGAIGSGPL